MTISSKELFRLARGSKGLGAQAMEMVDFLVDNAEETPHFFSTEISSQKISLRTMSTFSRALERRIYDAINQNKDKAFVNEVSNLFCEQFTNWGIDPTITHLYTGLPHGPWIKHETASSVKHLGATPEHYMIESLKLINFLCEFYFGKRLFSNVSPQKEYQPITWADLQNGQIKRQAFQESVFSDSEKEEELMFQLWQAGYLKCDLPR